jgi:carboxyl-terminal processing protease
LTPIVAQNAAGQARLTTSRAADTDARALPVLEAYVAALGGDDVLIRHRVVESVRIQQRNGQTDTLYRLEDRERRRFISRTRGRATVTESGYDGQNAWRRTPTFRGWLDASDVVARSMANPLPRPQDFRDGRVAYTRLADEVDARRRLNVLEATYTDPLGRAVPVRYFFDAETGLLARQVVGQADAGPSLQVTTRFGDWQTFDGERIAGTTVVEQPSGRATSRLLSVRFNVHVTDTIFAPVDLPPAASVTARPSTGGADSATSLRLATFEKAWSIVNSTYWDTTFGGVNWAAVRESYAPRVRAARSDYQFHALLDSMVMELGASHFRVVAPGNVVGLHSTGERAEGGTGLDLRWDGERLVVVEVTPGSSAAAARIGPGAIVTAIDGVDVDSLVRLFRQERPAFKAHDAYVRVRAAEYRLTGPVGTGVRVAIDDGSGQRRIVSLTRATSKGADRSVEWKVIPRNIGYVRITAFTSGTVEEFTRAIDSLRSTAALVIDLRGNPGGIGEMAPGMASALIDREGSLGTMIARYGRTALDFPGAGARAYRNPIAILVDELSASTSEIFAAGLQELGRATVFGRTTAGAVLPALTDLLPSGGALQHPVADFRTVNGARLEGRGVVPDVVVSLSAAKLRAGRDPMLDAAVSALARVGPR